MNDNDQPEKPITYEELLERSLKRRDEKVYDRFTLLDILLIGTGICAIYGYYLHVERGWSAFDSFEQIMFVIGFFTFLILGQIMLHKIYDYIVESKNIRYYKKMIERDKKEGF